MIEQAYLDRHERVNKKGDRIAVAPENRHLEHYIEENILIG